MMNAGFTESQIEKYKHSFLSLEKIQSLINIKEKYSSYDFIPFEYFEGMSVNQLKAITKLTNDYIENRISREELLSRSERYILKVKDCIHNISKLPDKILQSVNDDVSYIDKIIINFMNRSNQVISFEEFTVLKKSDIDLGIYKMLSDNEKLCFIDKPDIQIKIQFYNGNCNTIFADMRTDASLLEYEPMKALAMAEEEKERDRRVLYENYQERKCVALNKNEHMQAIKTFLSYAGGSAKVLNNRIIDIQTVNKLLIEVAKKGADQTKKFLFKFEHDNDDKYYYLNQDDNIEIITDDRLNQIEKEIDELSSIKEIRTLEHSIQHVSKINEKDVLALNQILSGQACDVIYKCERRMDLMNFLEFSRRNDCGYVYEDMAFIPHIENDLNYQIFYRNGEEWKFYNSKVDMVSLIDDGQLYKYLKAVQDQCSIKLSKQDRSVRKVRERGNHIEI